MPNLSEERPPPLRRYGIRFLRLDDVEVATARVDEMGLPPDHRRAALDHMLAALTLAAVRFERMRSTWRGYREMVLRYASEDFHNGDRL